MKQAVSARLRCTKLPLPLDTDSDGSSDCDCGICGLPYGSYGFSAMDVNCAWMHASRVDLESDVFLWDNVVCD